MYNINNTVYEYFYIKIGFSNSLINVRKIEKGTNSYLWIGYEEWESPKVNEDGLVIRKALKNGKEGKSRDLDQLYASAHSSNRKKTRLFGYSSNSFYIWEIIGDIIERDSNQSQYEEYKTYIESLKESHKNWIAKIFRKKNIEEVISDPIKMGRYVPVRCIYHTKREDLLPTVNTLSVYQYFSRGTFRNLSSIGTDRNSILSFIEDSKKLKRIMPMPIYKNKNNSKRIESLYGMFFRLYFDSLVSSSNYITFQEKLIWATLNPVQIEAFASLLCIEFGYSVDFFTANSVDTIDVIARTSNRRDKRKEFLFNDFMKHCGVHLPNDKVLKIQCKAYHENRDLENGIILFTPTKQSEKNLSPLSISIEEFFSWRSLCKIENNEFVLLDEWLSTFERFSPSLVQDK